MLVYLIVYNVSAFKNVLKVSLLKCGLLNIDSFCVQNYPCQTRPADWTHVLSCAVKTRESCWTLGRPSDPLDCCTSTTHNWLSPKRVLCMWTTPCTTSHQQNLWLYCLWNCCCGERLRSYLESRFKRRSMWTNERISCLFFVVFWTHGVKQRTFLLTF